MDDRERLVALVRREEAEVQQERRSALLRIGVLGVLTLAAVGYMSWLHGEAGKLDAAAVTQIARAEIQTRLPEVEEQLTQAAIDAAPAVMDRAEATVMRAPQAVRDHLEARLLAGTDTLLNEAVDALDKEIGGRADEYLATVAEGGGGDLGPEELDELMAQLRKDYRDRANGLLDELYVGYAKEATALNEHLIHLRDDEPVDERARIRREVIRASMALREHVIEPAVPAPQPESADAR